VAFTHPPQKPDFMSEVSDFYVKIRDNVKERIRDNVKERADRIPGPQGLQQYLPEDLVYCKTSRTKWNNVEFFWWPLKIRIFFWYMFCLQRELSQAWKSWDLECVCITA